MSLQIALRAISWEVYVNLAKFFLLERLSLYMEIGNKKAIYNNEEDIATYTIKTIDDPRTMNKTIYICPPKNILSQRQVVHTWEKLIGKEVKKVTLPKDDFLASMKVLDYAQQVGLSHYMMFAMRDALQALR